MQAVHTYQKNVSIQIARQAFHIAVVKKISIFSTIMACVVLAINL